jgi:hypothetical protein
MKTKLKLLFLIMAMTMSCPVIKTMKAQTVFAIDATYGANTVNTFDLSDPSLLTQIGVLSQDYIITGGTWHNDTWYISYIDVNTFEGYLGSVNVADGTLTPIGTTGVLLFDIAFDATTSTLYALGNTDMDFSNFDLYTINLSTGASTYIGNVGYDYSGLACSPNGTLYTYNGWLHSVNKSTGATTAVGNTLTGYQTGSYFPNIEYDITNNVLYLTGVFYDGNNLYSVNNVTGEATLLSAYPGGEDMLALAIPESAGATTNDIAVQSLVAPVTGYGLTTTEHVTITVSNEGSASQSNIPVSYTINGGPAVNETIAGPLTGGNQLDYTFSQTADLSDFQSYTILATASLPGDEVSINNSISRVITNHGYTHDLSALSVNGPSSTYAGKPATYTVFVQNAGGFTESGASYTVVLFDADESTIGTQSGVNIASGETKSFEFSVTFTTTGSTYINAKVFFTGDLNPANNQTENLNIFVQEQGLSNADVWTSAGPEGTSYVNCLGGEESNLFLGIGGGLYRTVNYGETWTNTGLTTSHQVYAVRKVGTSIFAAIGTSVYRSDDNGVTWAVKSSGLPGGAVKDIIAVGTEIFAGLNSSNSGMSGVFRSSDNGETWNSTTNTEIIDKMTVRGTVLFAGGPISGLRRSNDLGATWTSLSVGDQIFSLGANSTTVFAGTAQGVYRSTDDGNSWMQVSTGYISSLSVNGPTIYAAVFQGGAAVSTDNGTSWNSINTGLSSYWTTAIFAGETNIFAGHSAGISRSTNNGNNWFNANNGLRRLSISALLRSGNNIYATSGINLNAFTFISSDDGETWADFKILNEKVITIKEIGANSLVAKTVQPDGSSLNNYVTFDGGSNWVFTPSDLTNIDEYSALAAIGTTLYASIIQPDYSTIAYSSADYGATWTEISSLSGIQVTEWTVTGSPQFASTYNSSLYRSTDGGNTWTSCSGLPPSFGKIATITVGGKILLGLKTALQSGIYQSTDNGASWTTTGSQYGVSKFFLSGSDLYAVDNITIYHSSDIGLSWTDIGINAPTPNLNSFNVVNGILFVGTSGGGVVASTDKGLSWFSANNGFVADNLPYIYNSFVIGADHLLAGSAASPSQAGQSVWRRNLLSFTTPEQPSAINGSATPCTGASYTYSVTDMAGVTYAWQIPADWVITAGETTSSIEVTVGTIPGIVLVMPSNEFGIGPAQFMVVTPTSGAPSQPGAITGPDAPDMDTEVVYSVEQEYGVTYNWSFPEGWVQQDGGNTHSVTVLVGEASGDVTVTATSPCGTSEPAVLYVTPFNPNMPLVFMVTGGGSYCEGDAGLPVGLSGSQEETVYTLYKDGAVQSTLTGDGNPLSFGNQLQGTYTIIADNGPNTIWMSGSAVLTESSSIPVSVVISSDPQVVCEGSSVTITAIGENGGTNPAYAWYLNGEATGSNSPEYTFAPVDSDQVYVVLTSDLGECVVNNPATSNTISIQTTENLPVSVSIVPDANDVCAGTPVTFTASPVNGGSPNYQWYVNGVQTGTDQASFSYIPEDEDGVYVVMTSSQPCTSNNPATSNVVTMVINALPEVEVQISADNNNVCAGTLVTFTATPVNGGENPEYAWQVNGEQQGADEPTFTYTPENGDQVNVVMTSDLPCTQDNPAISNTVFMAVNEILPVSVVITADDDAVCVGTPVTLTATPQNGGTATYQWYVNTNPVGVNEASLTYTPENGDMVYVELTSSLSCVSGNPATSNIIEITVDQEVTPSVTISASTNPVFSGEPVTFTATPVNGGTDPEYLWFLNGFNVGAGASYTYIPVDGDEVYVVMTSSLECLTNMSAVSNTIVVEVITGTLVMKSDSVRVTSYDNNVVITRRGGIKGHVEVIDLTGRLIQERTIAGEDRMEIAIESGSGIYLVRVNSSEGPVNEKVFIR